MKKTIKIFLLIVLSLCVNVSASAFDPTRNYQGRDAKAYIGDYLYVVPFISESGYTNDIQHGYKRFMDEDLPATETEHSMMYFYHFDPKMGVRGTEHKWLAGKVFYVKDVYNLEGYESSWVFDMVNADDPSDKCKYVYYSWLRTQNNNIDFPFISLTHFEWLRDTYIGKEVVIGTHVAGSSHEKHSYYHRNFDKDALTKESISYSHDTAHYMVKNVFVHDTLFQLCFRLTNGKHTIDCPIGLLYDPYSKEQYATRIFTMNQWSELCQKYTSAHMLAVMRGEILVGMTFIECRWAIGSQTGKKKESELQKDETWSCKWPTRTDWIVTTFKDDVVIKVETKDMLESVKSQAKQTLNKVLDWF